MWEKTIDLYRVTIDIWSHLLLDETNAVENHIGFYITNYSFNRRDGACIDGIEPVFSREDSNQWRSFAVAA
jgi:hypothetical protein